MRSERREIVFRPAWDKRHSDPSKNYGIHGVEMAWFLHGPEGAIQFVVYTAWHLPEVAAELKRDHPHPRLFEPMPADLGYHSYIPRYEGQTRLTENCSVLGGRPCYYDGSSLQAIKVFDILVGQGEEAVWKLLEEEYELRLSKILA